MATLKELLDKLRQPIPDNLISQKTVQAKKEGGKSYTASYMAWYDLADLLDERVGAENWEFKLIDSREIGGRHTQCWELSIIGDDRTLRKQAIGDEDTEVDAYGSPATNVQAQCLRRCCAYFGLGRKMWEKKKTTGYTPRQKGEVSREEWLKLKEARDAIQ